MKHLTPLLLGILLAAVAGCATSPSHFYTLNSTARGDGASAVDCSVIVGPVIIPASVDRPQFVVVTGPNRVEFDEFNRWDAPLADSIARAVSGNLRELLGTSRVVAAPMADFGQAYRVNLRVEQFESVRGKKGQNGEVRLNVVWSVRSPSGNKLSSGTSIAREPAQGNSFAALAAAHSRALAKVSADIAQAIRVSGGNE